MVSRMMGSYPAPPFPTHLESQHGRVPVEWINTGGKALTLQDLRGKLVLLDFWTYG